MRIHVTVNGTEREVDVAESTTLLDFVRDDLHLTGTKECCDVGECGACTLLVEGRAVNSCLMLAAEVEGGELTTIEGLSENGKLSRLQDAFLAKGAV
ncbi:MAG TPA: 2Fe-2S iron-sulfur cluster-binding protein, partial [Candidatus Dormibacteraeota bacterium]